MKHFRYIAFLFSLLAATCSLAQEAEKTLSATQVMEIVKQYHPVARQADINIEKAKSAITMARGQFDPLLENKTAQKTFDGTSYYYYNRPELSIPAWFGVEVNAGLENLSGNRTDPTETKGKTSYIGLTVPLAKNLLMDKRRAALQTAKIYREASFIEKRNMLNDLLLDAMKAYWQWAREYEVYTILSNAVAINEKRMRLVRTAYQLGDRPAIDTTEALTQLQQYQLLQSQAWLDYQNAGLELAVFLWTAETKPYYLPESVHPAGHLQHMSTSAFELPELNSLLEVARKNHPELLLYNYKLDVLGLEKKLKFQELLPTVNFRYNQLGKGYDLLKAAGNPLFENNYQYGLTFRLPLRLSEGRGEYRMAKLKISQTQLEQSQKQLQVETKVRAYFNELNALKKQILLQEKAWQNFQALQRGEETRFFAGESSLFLVNARENKSLENLQKLVELKAKYYTNEAQIKWAAGTLWQ